MPQEAGGMRGLWYLKPDTWVEQEEVNGLCLSQDQICFQSAQGSKNVMERFPEAPGSDDVK